MNVRGEGDLEKIFNEIDTNGNGFLDLDEFRVAMKKFEILLSEKELRNLFDYLDVKKEGEFSYQRFIEFLQREHLDLIKIGNKIRNYIDQKDISLTKFFLEANNG
jgi:Ca2+-binding EF-hand superfamily protein